MRASSLRMPRRALLAIGTLAAAICIPLTAGFFAPSELALTGGVLAAAGDRAAISESIAVSDYIPLYVDRGMLTSIDQTGVRGADTVSRLLLEGGALRLAFKLPTLDGDAQRQAGSAPQTLAPLLSHLAAMGFSQLQVRRSQFDFVLADGRIISLSDVSADLVPSRKGAFQLSGSASLFGQSIKFEVTSGAPVPETRAAQPRRVSVPAKVTIRAPLLDASFEGRFVGGDGMRLIGEADFRAKRLRALSRWFGLAVPSGTDLREATIAGPFEWGNGRLAFQKATASVDGNRGEGALALTLGAARPSLEGTFDFKVFDVAPQLANMLAESAKPVAQPSHADGGAIATAFNADLRLSAAKVKLPNLETGRGALAISLAGGRLQADVTELEVEGGVAMGLITLDAASALPRLAVKAKLTNVDPGRPLQSYMKRNPLLGRVNVVFEGAGHGHSLPAMLADFAGRGTGQATAGRIGIDLRALAYSARNANSVGWSAAGKGMTPFDQLDARFQISKGAVTLEAAQARTGGATIQAAGKIDLPGRLLDLTLQLKDNASDPSKSEELVMRGSWPDPVISLKGRPFTTTAPAVKGASTTAPLPVIGR